MVADSGVADATGGVIVNEMAAILDSHGIQAGLKSKFRYGGDPSQPIWRVDRLFSAVIESRT